MKVIEKGFILYKKCSWDDRGSYSFKPWEYTDGGYVTVCPHNNEFEVPDDFDPIPGQVANLNAKALALKAKFAKDMMEVDKEKSKLLCITMDEVPA